MNTPAIDFSRPRGVPRVGWCLLAAGLITVVLAAWLHHGWDVNRARHEAQVLEQQDAQRRAAEAAKRPRLQSVEERGLQHIAPQLREPWLPTLRVIEAATESPVFLLALRIDPASGQIQLDGEAPSFDEVMAYVQRLSEDGALTGAHLGSHEAVTDPSGRTSVRFMLLAHWSLR